MVPLIIKQDEKSPNFLSAGINSNIESEKTLERLLKSLVEKEMKGWCLKLLSQHITGLPDRLCLVPRGIIFFAEIKTTKKKPKAIQLWVHAKLRALGFAVYLIDSKEHLENIKQIYTIYKK